MLFTEVLKAQSYLWFTRSLFYYKLLKLIFLNIILLLIFILGIITFSAVRKHLLLTLFRLEYLVLVLFLSLFFFLLKFGFEIYFILIFLVFTVCEGALGLGVLVNIIRRHGNDLLSSLSILSW